jgi:mannose-6-phosphate isomerase
MHMVHGRAQHYAWGDPTSIPELLSLTADGRPWAEWWMGTHPLASSTIDDGEPLQSVAGDLPYLLKLIAAAQPLSLQAHPDAIRAAAGFDREESRGVPRDSPARVYRDALAKPEMLCALTSFDTLCGFRRIDATVAVLRSVGAFDLAAFVEHDKLATVVAALYHGDFDVSTTITACAHSERPEATLVTELADAYPGDPSVAVTLLLNRIVLTGGDALFLGPGNLHAYLRGFGVEIMANSDNVVRGGLTVKHVDVDELLDVLDFEPLPDPVVRPVEVEPGRWRYNTPNTPFVLWRLEVGAAQRVVHHALGRELLLWVEGREQGDCRYLAPGEIIALTGPATVFRVEEASG